MTAESEEARARGLWLAETLGLRPFILADDRRALYHAGASIASNFLVTLYRVAADLVERAGAPPEALVPLMERTIANGFQLTGPIARGDWSTVDRHREVLHDTGLRGALRRARGGDAAMIVARSIGELDLPRHGIVGLVPTMGALHAGHAALFAAARAGVRRARRERLREPGAVLASTQISAAYPRDLERDAAFAAEHGVDVVFAPSAAEMYPDGFATWVEPGGAAEGLEGAHRPGHFRGVATVCLKLFNLVRPQIAWFGRKDAQQVAVVKQLVRDLNVPVEIRVVETARDHDGLAFSSRNALLSAEERGACARASARAGNPRPVAAPRRARSRRASSPTTSRSRTSTAPPSLVAARVGSTRLIDNVPLPKGARP